MLQLSAPNEYVLWRRTGSVGTTEAFEDFEYVKQGQLLNVRRVCAYVTHATQSLDVSVGAYDGDTFSRMDGHEDVSALDHWVSRDNLFIRALHRLRIGLIGSAAGTTYEIVVQGFIHDMNKE